MPVINHSTDVRYLQDVKVRALKVKDEENKVHVAIRPALCIAFIFGFCPLNGLTTITTSDITFKPFGWKAIYSYTVIILSAFMEVLSMIRITKRGIRYDTAGDIMFFGSNTIVMILFVKLSKDWREITECWLRVQKSTLPTKRRTKIKIQTITCIITFLALFEHLSSDAYNFTQVQNKSKTLSGIFKLYFLKAFPLGFDTLPYSVGLGVLFSLVNLVDAIAWNYMDLIIIILALALADSFHDVNALFYKIETKHVEKGDWKKLRETYNKLYVLTKLLDEKLSPLILMSFGSNLYYICYQLLNSLKPIKSVSQGVYFFGSFLYLLGRTMSVCISLASVPVVSKDILTSLFSTSSYSYNIEVQRLITQVSNEELSLTGCQFFAVNRNLIITIIGTIITYEIVLVQFNSLTTENSLSSTSSTNNTCICPS